MMMFFAKEMFGEIGHEYRNLVCDANEDGDKDDHEYGGGYCVNEMVKEGKLLRTSLGFVFWVYLEFYSVTFGVLCQSVEG